MFKKITFGLVCVLAVGHEPHAQKGACTQGRAKEHAKRRTTRAKERVYAAGRSHRRPPQAAAAGRRRRRPPPQVALFGALFCAPLRARALLRVRCCVTRSFARACVFEMILYAL